MKELWAVWDEAGHPSDTEADDEDNVFPESGEWEDLEDLPQVPSIDRLPTVVDYSSRGPDDFVISGPVGDARGQGRKFDSHRAAHAWANAKWGASRVNIIDAGMLRWAVLIKGVK
jgi:hypothetical protein